MGSTMLGALPEVSEGVANSGIGKRICSTVYIKNMSGDLLKWQLLPTDSKRQTLIIALVQTRVDDVVGWGEAEARCGLEERKILEVSVCIVQHYESYQAAEQS